MESLDKFIKSTKFASAKFTQKVFDEDNELIQESNGDFMFMRPGKFIWQYKNPFEQIIGSDGESVWIFDKDLNQMIVRRVERAFSSTPAALLAGSNEIDKYYLLTSDLEPDGSLDWLLLTPLTEDGVFKKVRLGFSDKSLKVMELEDYLQQRTIISFSLFDLNTKINKKTFVFVPTDGVEVIQE